MAAEERLVLNGPDGDPSGSVTVVGATITLWRSEDKGDLSVDVTDGAELVISLTVPDYREPYGDDEAQHKRVVGGEDVLAAIERSEGGEATEQN